MNPKLNQQQAAKVESIDAALREARDKLKVVQAELVPCEGLVWNRTFRKALLANQIMLRQMQKMNEAIEQLKKDAKR